MLPYMEEHNSDGHRLITWIQIKVRVAKVGGARPARVKGRVGPGLGEWATHSGLGLSTYYTKRSTRSSSLKFASPLSRTGTK